MDSQKNLALFSDVDENVALSFKDHQDEKGQRAIKIDVRHMLNLAPFQKSTEAVMEGIPDGFSTANEWRRVEDAQESKVYSQAAPAAPWHFPGLDFSSVPPVGKTSSFEDGAEDEAKTEDKGSKVLIDIGIDNPSEPPSVLQNAKDITGPKFKKEESKECRYRWPVTILLTLAFMFCLSMGLVFLDQDITFNPSLNKMKLQGQSVNVFLQEIKRRSTSDTQISIYQTIDANKVCSVVKKAIQANCRGWEKAICVRNVTYKNLVAVCAPNISMPGAPASCPVLTFSLTTPPIPIVQPDPIATCENCSHYSVWDVDKHPECLMLDMDLTTTITSDVTHNSVGSKGQQDAEGLSGGEIAAIIVGVIFTIIGILVLLVLLYIFGLLKSLLGQYLSCAWTDFNDFYRDDAS